MKLEPFALERMQSTFENEVAFNLSESGVHPLTLGELIDSPSARAALLAESLRYTQTNGTVPLREAIAAMYPSATADHIQVTNGGAEANYLTTWNLVEPGDEVVMMVPNFMQAWGLARAFGADAKAWPLVNGGDGHWRVDSDALARLVTRRTKLIAICNPNNPTGARFEADDLDRIAAIADRHGSWILSDEIYRGAERDGRETPTMWGRSDRVLVTSGLAKAYGLPGLRIGWIAGPPERIASLWSYHDYTTIAPGALNDALARHALEPARRAALLARTRGILNRNYPIVSAWLDDRAGLFSYAPPHAGAIVYARYHHPINSTDLVTRLRVEHSVLVVPGDHFGMDHYLRLGFGDESAHLRLGLQRLGGALADCGLRVGDAGAHEDPNRQSTTDRPSATRTPQ
ncbi:MAG: aspartate aminotransferase [Acidobacteria bacterium]|nr:aspartate aminotransferase [Acidobacteriota bacterium]